MTCKKVRNELVAYCDGELSERNRACVAAHLSECATCAQEEARLARLEGLLTNLERIAPSPDFAATFWHRLEQEGDVEQENRFIRWWRGVANWQWRDWLTDWQLAPMMAAAAGLLVIVGALFLGPLKRSSVPIAPDIPAQVAKEPRLFLDYRVVANLETFAHFEEITSTQAPPKEEVPLDLLKDPSFFVDYPILHRMDQFENMDAVLRSQPGEEGQLRG